MEIISALEGVSTVEGTIYIGGYSLLWRDIISAVDGVQCCGGCLVLWRMFSAVKGVQYCEACLVRSYKEIMIDVTRNKIYGLLLVGF